MIKDTMIATPSGDIPIQDLRVGDTVTTLDGTAKLSNIRIKESNRTVTVTLHTYYTAGNFTLLGDWDEEIFTLPNHDRKMGGLHRINMTGEKTQVLNVETEYNKRIPTYLITLDGGDYYYANGVKVRGEHGTR